MSKISFSNLNGKLFTRQIQRWSDAAKAAAGTDLLTLRRQRARARELKGHLDQLIHAADDRLALPPIGSTSFPLPHNTDWSWRPPLWRNPLSKPGLSSAQNRAKMGEEVTLFHDCPLAEMTLRQLRNLREEDLAPYGLLLDVFQFDGSFLSLVVDIPPDGIDSLKRTHVLRMDMRVEMEKPLEIFARLNIKNGPNTEQIVRELRAETQNHLIEFDLAYSNLNEKRVERAWIDLIFEGPQMNQVVLRDLTFSRRPRANL